MTLIATRKSAEKAKGDITSWVDEVKAQGYYWTTPDKLARKGMLLVAAKVAGDFLLPEAFWGHTTFTDDGNAPQLDEKEEQEQGVTLGLSIRQYLSKGKAGDKEDTEKEAT